MLKARQLHRNRYDKKFEPTDFFHARTPDPPAQSATCRVAILHKLLTGSRVPPSAAGVIQCATLPERPGGALRDPEL